MGHECVSKAPAKKKQKNRKPFVGAIDQKSGEGVFCVKSDCAVGKNLELFGTLEESYIDYVT